ncbi:MAG: hypothetical protein ACLVEX_14315, partial [Ruthenibacterium lactatiformans]
VCADAAGDAGCLRGEHRGAYAHAQAAPQNLVVEQRAEWPAGMAPHAGFLRAAGGKRLPEPYCLAPPGRARCREGLENTGYTRPGYAGLYNVFIMEEVHTILSAGAGGSTKLVGPDGHIRRIFNHKYPLEYIERFDVVQARKQGVDDFYAKYADLDPETAR